MLPAPRCLRQHLVQSCRVQCAGAARPRAERSRLVLGPLPSATPWRRSTSTSTETQTSSTIVKHESARRLSNVSPGVRIKELAEAGFKTYPRSESTTSTQELKNRWAGKTLSNELFKSVPDETYHGRIVAKRAAGSKLLFCDLDAESGDRKLQIIVDKQKLDVQDEDTITVKQFGKLVRRGDIISVTGKPFLTNSNELSILASALPQILSPCLHPIPSGEVGPDSEVALDKHVQMLVDHEIVNILLAKSCVITHMRDFLRNRQFAEVQTPILAASAGGATARSFKTSATEFPDRELALRIAPELWLKRLIVGGMSRVFEVGPSFRNEGLDKTHNPEFMTCEFYAASWTLEKLLEETQSLITYITSRVDKVSSTFQECMGQEPTESWPTIDFIPALNEALKVELPDLSSPDARGILLEIFRDKSLALPNTPTLPRLLDELSTIYLEPQCFGATWIINTPECLSPLAKSSPHPDLPSQRVAARAELFIQNKEVVNCYEEENDPSEQKRKFIEQQKHARLPLQGQAEAVDDEAMTIDHDYIRCLEWGLPPTGGWGCGIERLTMLMLGRDNIKDVLSFGNLRQVTRNAEKASRSESIGRANAKHRLKALDNKTT